MIIVRGIKLYPGENEKILKKRAAAKLRLSADAIGELKPIKKSLDARKKNDVHYTYSLALDVGKAEKRLLARPGVDISEYTETKYSIPTVHTAERPLIVGFGPAGMFAALVLALAGARPIVIERGEDVDRRLAAVETFRRGWALDTECNAQFGEGGAGACSDGKLNTGIKDPRMGWMLRQFALHGAPESITYDAKPHIGTDVLVSVVKSIRQDVISLGGEIHFLTKLEGLCIEDGQICGAELSYEGGRYTLPCRELILATGHSARDTFETLQAQGVPMEPKPFSMGVRIEHLQTDVDMAQYGRKRGALPAADYALNVHLNERDSAYTFCMCPGGYVFAAASEDGGVVTNGMSYSGRSGENANSAVLVTLRTEDFPGADALSGMRWQREIEQAAYRCGGNNYLAPAQLVSDFLAHRPSEGPGRVKPTYKPGVSWCELHSVLPERITGVLEKALPELGKKLAGFDDGDAVLTAPETRSSSPVRILRDSSLSSAVAGLYPCGEGAGYAGGISSAAIDGIRCAEAVLTSLKVRQEEK